MVAHFANALAIHLGFNIAAGIFTLYSLFKKDSQDAINQCMAQSADATMDGCKSAIAIMKGLMVAIYVITWLVELCKSINFVPKLSLIVVILTTFLIDQTSTSSLSAMLINLMTKSWQSRLLLSPGPCSKSHPLLLPMPHTVPRVMHRLTHSPSLAKRSGATTCRDYFQNMSRWMHEPILCQAHFMGLSNV